MKIYTVEFNNGESYEDNRSWVSKYYFNSIELAEKYLDTLGYEQDKYNKMKYNAVVSYEYAKIIELIQPDVSIFTIQELDRSIYQNIGLNLIHSEIKAGQHYLTFSDSVINGLLFESFSCYSEYNKNLILAIPMLIDFIKQSLKKLRIDNNFNINVISVSASISNNRDYCDDSWNVEFELLDSENNYMESYNLSVCIDFDVSDIEQNPFKYLNKELEYLIEEIKEDLKEN